MAWHDLGSLATTIFCHAVLHPKDVIYVRVSLASGAHLQLNELGIYRHIGSTRSI